MCEKWGRKCLCDANVWDDSPGRSNRTHTTHNSNGPFSFQAAVPGTTIPYTHDEWEPQSDPDSVAEVVRRADHLGPDKDIVVPAIPALDIARRGKADPELDSATLQQWPDGLREPLLKGNGASPPPKAVLKAVASGVRSCVVKTAAGWFRLKGCGNHDEGFTIRESGEAATANGGDPVGIDGAAAKPAHTRQMRGSAWLHTAIRENYVLAQLSRVLEPRGILGGNSAYGMYLYGAPNQPFGPDVSVPACVVCTTRGERRLGSHVLAGLELLLPQLLDTAALDTRELLAAFPPARLALPTAGDPVVSTATLMCDHMLAFEYVCACV